MSNSIGIGKPNMSISIGIGKGNNKPFNRHRKAENESFDRHQKKESKALLYIDILNGKRKKKGLLSRACALRAS